MTDYLDVEDQKENALICDELSNIFSSQDCVD